ncbi:hypothetical protein HCCG_01669 [Helicobacter cinaedi CCUG 18818 = ATCC BAA-847]|uniref:Uncharacterized protein n=1 Tax=Helicobacter cinaedi CCUG 18818 = ATCC BAA-847 TaxID=537971 RepID=A0ABN0BC29_9HELI|nr:hypothetical protein HCCG_01669 [Helicobacter cinaedi CCUG 18818 = ATCC BAA-847]
MPFVGWVRACKIKGAIITLKNLTLPYKFLLQSCFLFLSFYNLGAGFGDI